MSPVIHAVRHNGNDANVLVVALAKLKLLLADKLEHPVLRGGRRTEGGRGRGGGGASGGWQAGKSTGSALGVEVGVVLIRRDEAQARARQSKRKRLSSGAGDTCAAGCFGE